MSRNELIRDAVEGILDRLDGRLSSGAAREVRKALRRRGAHEAFDLLLERLAAEQLAVPAAVARMIEVVARGVEGSGRLAGVEVDGLRIELTAAELALLGRALEAVGDPAGLCVPLAERLEALTGGEPR